MWISMKSISPPTPERRKRVEYLVKGWERATAFWGYADWHEWEMSNEELFDEEPSWWKSRTGLIFANIESNVTHWMSLPV